MFFSSLFLRLSNRNSYSAISVALVVALGYLSHAPAFGACLNAIAAHMLYVYAHVHVHVYTYILIFLEDVQPEIASVSGVSPERRESSQLRILYMVHFSLGVPWLIRLIISSLSSSLSFSHVYAVQ